MKNNYSFPAKDSKDIKSKMLNWANQFSIFCFLDNQEYNFEAPDFECLLAVGSRQQLTVEAGNAFDKLRSFAIANQEEWLFGHFSYDLKNETERLSSSLPDNILFPDLNFFVPETVVLLHESTLKIFTENQALANKIFNAIQQGSAFLENIGTTQKIKMQSRITELQYVEKMKQLQQHILKGDCYEINFCQEWYAIDATINPVVVYNNLSSISPTPFAALYKLDDKFCICASPERYLKKIGNKILSQPIKGTATRNQHDPQADENNRQQLLQSPKEKSENVMVVDLVRNDLSKFCKQGSVQVDELFGVYSFPQVHQMISTVSGQLADNVDWITAVSSSFPMGSMTGAPKKRVMELIEKYELTKRGLFSGSIGYKKPNGDFDFNVVIRSIFYNHSTKYISFQTGGAITFYSDPTKEYEECLLKAAAMKKVIENS